MTHCKNCQNIVWFNAFSCFSGRSISAWATKLCLLIVISLLSGCYAVTGTLFSGGSGISVGPEGSSEAEEESNQSPSAPAIQKELEVIVPVFDPNIPQDSSTWERRGIWPELRRVESIKFALKMKKALEDTNQLGAVRVTPDQKVTGDLYVLGTINESNGEDININVKVVSIEGTVWLSKNYNHRVDEYFITNIRNKGKNPYDPVFEQAAADIVKRLQAKKHDYLKKLNQLTEVRFGYSMSDDSFAEYLKFKGSRVELVRSPSDYDPMFRRIHQYRVEDQLFTDKMQQHYYDFSKKVEPSYKTWQEAAFSASKARREASNKAALQAFIGILAIGLGAAAAANNDDYSAGRDAAAVGGIAAGALLLSSSAQNYKESRFHRDTLMELGKSIDVEIAPQVVEFEEKTIELTGDAAAQFNQWRAALRRIYAEEQTPGIPL